MSLKLRPFTIGNITVDFPVVLAALAGYSDLPYRMICRSCGSAYCTTEAMLDKQMLLDGRLRRRLVKIGDQDHPIAAQIMGSDPAVMAQSAKILCDMGFDVIDLNFACPVRKVLGRRRGGFMMGQPGRVLDVIAAVRAAVTDRPVTIKLRRAFHEIDQEYQAFWQIAQGAFDAGVAAICVHARSVEQKYRGQANWQFLSAVKQRFPDRTILGSGDVHSAADAIAMLVQTGVDGVTAARGAIGNPWLFTQARELARRLENDASFADQPPDSVRQYIMHASHGLYKPDIAVQREIIDRHFKMTFELYGPRRGPKIMRKFGIKYARVHPTPAKVRTAFVDLKSAKQWQAVLDEFYPLE